MLIYVIKILLHIGKIKILKINKRTILSNITKISRKLNVLYVEDNKKDRQDVLKILKEFFTHIDTANDGISGLSKYIQYYDKNKIYYDIVISDINMPHMNGIEMFFNIFEINKNQSALAISSHDNADDLKKLIDIGVECYIHKPIDTDIFTEKITKIVKHIYKNREKIKRLKEIEKLNQELDALVDSFDTYVIASRTDLKGIITYSSKAYENISGYTKEELIGKPHNIVRHPDMPKSVFKEMWATIKQEKLWTGEVKNLKKDGSYYWVKAFIAPYYDKNGKHIGYSAIRIDITAQKEVERLHEQVNTLLNNAGEGFLSFDEHLKCESGYSKVCLDIFNTENIAEKDISELLFSSDPKNKQLFLEGIENILKCDDDFSKELLLSLLPKEQVINEKTINIQYKLIDNNRFMLILNDITKTKQLEKKLNQQRDIQKMIVSVVSNQNEFIELKNDFENFLKNPPNDKKIFLRKLHTFKGIFAQKNMIHIPSAIHHLEMLISETKQENIIEVFQKSNLKMVFEKDLDIIEKTVGKDFIHTNSYIKIEKQILEDIEKDIKSLDKEMVAKEKIEQILSKIYQLKYKSLYEMLNKYKSHIKRISDKLNKPLYPLEIEGDKQIKLSDKYKPFIDSLIHIFNNSIDHGIEKSLETRLQRGKKEAGKIGCKFYLQNDLLFLEIYDDGNGIDTNKLVHKAVEKGIIDNDKTQTLNMTDKLNLIFADNLSTKNRANTTSGRGVGMSAVKEEVEKIGGNIKIETKIGYGTKFKFILPIKEV